MQTDLRINASLSPENNGAKSQRGVNTSHRAVSFICRVLLWFDVIKMCCLVFKAPDCSLRPVKALRSHMCSSQRQWQTTRKFSPCQWTSCFLGVFFFLVCHVSTSLKRYDSHYFISLYLFRTKAAWYRGGKNWQCDIFCFCKTDTEISPDQLIETFIILGTLKSVLFKTKYIKYV